MTHKKRKKMILYLKKNAGGEYRRVVIDPRESVPLNFTFEDIENPTNYVAEYTYSVKLPVCEYNNKFFDFVNLLDSVVLHNGFSPAESMQYMATTSAGMFLSTGTATLTDVSGDYYTLRLVGSQARLFQQLLNAGYDTKKDAEDSDYYLMTDWLKKRKTMWAVTGEQRNMMCAHLVYASWMIDNPIFDFTTLRNTYLKNAYGFNLFSGITETQAFIASLVGFAPTAQGKYKDFDSGAWLEAGTVEYLNSQTAATPTIMPVLCNRRDGKGETVQDVIADDGVIEPQIGEYRSYYQQPYIYISALWHFFQQEFAAITDGYTLNLDSRWFNAYNAELRRLVYMLPRPAVDRERKIDVVSMPNTGSGLNNTHVMPQGYIRTTDRPFQHTISNLSAKSTINTEAVSVEAGQELNADVSLTLDIENFAYSQTYTYLDDNAWYYYNGYNPYEMTVQVVGGGNNIVAERKYIIYPVSSDGVVTMATMQADTYINDLLIALVYTTGSNSGHELLTPEYNPWKKGYSADHSLTIHTNIRAVVSESGNYRVRVQIGYYNNQLPFVMKGTKPSPIDEQNTDLYYYSASPGNYQITMERYKVTVTGSVSESHRSGATVSLENLFADIVPFNVLLQYSKIRHLYWQVDDVAKIVTVKRATDYFADLQSVNDITRCVDRSITIKPLAWNEHKVLFNLGDMECSYVDGYADRYGHGYGDKELITTNKTSKETKELFNGNVKASAMLSQTVVPIPSLTARKTTPEAIEVVPMPLNVSDGKSANVHGNFYYRHNNGTWQGEILSGWRDNHVLITDDAPIEAASGVYCWRGQGDIPGTALSISKRPVFRTVSADGKQSVLFAPVQEQYTMTPDEPEAYMYERYWKGYIEEAYNVQNKLIEVTAKVSTILLEKIRHNPLVYVQNNLYVVLNIKGWIENGMCRLTLRQVHDLTKLTGGATLPREMQILTEDGEELVCEDEDNLIQ